MSEGAVVDAMRPGDHISWIVEDDASLGRILAAYVGGAVPARHKVACFVHATTPAETLAGLAGAGVDPEALLARGQLEILPARDAYLGPGRFDLHAMIDRCLLAVAQARAEGYAGLRLVGDMSWAAGCTGDDLVEYEARVNRVYAGGYAIGLCLYDRRHFDADRLATLLAAHPGAVDGSVDEGRAWAPLLRLRRTDGADGAPVLRLAGEADISNRTAVTTVLDGLFDDGPFDGPSDGPPDGPPGQGRRPATLDVSALRFVDVATAHHVVELADRCGGLRVVGVSEQLARLFDFAGSALVPGMVFEPA